MTSIQRVLLGLALVWFSTAVPAAAREISVIAGIEFPVQSISLQELQDLFLGNLTVLSGRRVKPLLQDWNEEITQAFLKKAMGMTQEAYTSYWNTRLFQEGGFKPRHVTDSKDMIATIKTMRGSVGFVWSDELPTQGDLKVLLSINVD
jgi:hypothetical protein